MNTDVRAATTFVDAQAAVSWAAVAAGAVAAAALALLLIAFYRFRRGAWLVDHIALERYRRFSVNI